MKFLRFLVLFAISLGLLIAGVKYFFPQQLQKVATPLTKNNPTSSLTPISFSKALFVPYWTVKSGILDESFDTYLYFGIAANTAGINTTEPGYLNLGDFSKITTGKNNILVVRLLDQKTIDAIFADSTLEQKIIKDTIVLAKKYNFSGVAIDLEYPSLAFSSVTESISSFISNFSTSLKNQSLKSFVTIYGDTFYRVRPFDVKKIGEKVDGVYVMAYDFHKAKGNPGPNFPLETGDDENYSFKTMITDFSTHIPREKLTIIFGMFGYDWKISDKGTSLTEGEPKSTADIEKLFVSACLQKNCKQIRNSASEPSVMYIDKDGSNHIIWYEDILSMHKKIEYLQTMGIGNTAVWANSYY